MMKKIAIMFFCSIAYFACFLPNAEAALKPLPPNVACSYMQDFGLATDGWKNRQGALFGCSSPYKHIETGRPPKNNLAYYVDGNATQAIQLRLVLNVNNRDREKSARKELLKAAEHLAKKALGAKRLPQSIEKAITDGRGAKARIGEAWIEVVRMNWATGKGYDMRVFIS